MPKPRNISAYPSEYFQLLNKALNEPVVLTLSDKKEAIALRFDFYGFRTALKDWPDADPQLALMCDGLEFLIDENVLKIQVREKSEHMAAIRQALGE